MAGTAVDTALFPLDTLKTRMQSKAGFAASGGFRGVYSGLTSAVIGSAPGGKKKKEHNLALNWFMQRHPHTI